MPDETRSTEETTHTTRRSDPMAYYFQDLFLIGNRQATRLYLIRHGQAGNNLGELDTASADLPLTEVGREQARRLGERMASYGVDAIYSSPLLRARETAQAIADRTGLEVIVVHDLREIDSAVEGNIRGARSDAVTGISALAELSDDEIKARIEANPTWDSFPQAEPSLHARNRIRAAMDQIIADNPGKRVAVVCHAGVIQMYVSMVLGIRTDFPFYPFNASITSIRALNDRRALWRLNDISHLEGMPVGLGGIS